MMRAGKAGAVAAVLTGLVGIASCVGVAACGGFSGDDGAAAADGGPDTSVGGEARGDVDLGLPKGLVLVHRESLVIDVNVIRKPPFTKGMTIVARGLPPGLGSEAVDITPIDVVAKLKLVVGKEVPQGTLANVTIEAMSDGAVIGKATLDAFVKGSSGELDTTFGTAGRVDFDVDYNGLAMRADGSFYVLQSLNNSEVRRYTKDGVLDTTFGTNGSYATGAATPMSAIVWKEPSLFVAGGAPLKSYVRKLDADGKPDTTYGVQGTYENPLPFSPSSVSGLAIGPGGEALLAGSVGYAGNGGSMTMGMLESVTAAGVFAGRLEWGAPDGPTTLAGALYDGTRLVGVGEKGRVVRLKSATQYDADFGDNGTVKTFLTAGLTAIAADGSGNYVIGGVDTATEQLFVGRIKAPAAGPGAYDATFNSTGFLLTGITTAAGGGHLAIAADKKILQTATVSVNSVYRCRIARYTAAGALDMTFGEGGSTTPEMECYAGQVATQPDGRIVMAGRRLMRFWP